MKRLLDNENTAIRYYRSKKDQLSSHLIISFAPFAFGFEEGGGWQAKDLLENGYDIITVQQRTDNWYQDLSITAFAKAVGPICERYENLTTFGSSMGAYAAVYYASSIGARVLAFSPRLCIHPRYYHQSNSDHKRPIQLVHREMNKALSPHLQGFIIYDDKSIQDKQYIESEIFGNKTKLERYLIPYSGHPSICYLEETKQKSIFIKSCIEDKKAIDIARRRNRRQSSSYLLHLAESCWSRKKYQWAEKLVKKSLEIDDHSIWAQMLLSSVLYQKGEKKQALETAKKAYSLRPLSIALNKSYTWLLATDGQLKQALKIIDDTINKVRFNAELKIHRLNLLEEFGGKDERFKPFTTRCRNRSSIDRHKDIIMALFLRECRTRFGGKRLGILWEFISPMAQVGMFATMFYLTGRRMIDGAPSILFLLSGIMPFMFFSSVMNKIMSAIDGNAGLFGFKIVRPFHTMVTRLIVETLVFSCVFSFLWRVLNLVQESKSQVMFLPILEGLSLLILLALSLGIGAAMLAVKFPEVKNVIPLVMRPMYFLSGIMYAPSMLPQQAMDVLQYNPVLICITTIRHGFFQTPLLEVGSSYVAFIILMLAYPAAYSYKILWKKAVST